MPPPLVKHKKYRELKGKIQKLETEIKRLGIQNQNSLIERNKLYQKLKGEIAELEEELQEREREREDLEQNLAIIWRQKARIFTNLQRQLKLAQQGRENYRLQLIDQQEENGNLELDQARQIREYQTIIQQLEDRWNIFNQIAERGFDEEVRQAVRRWETGYNNLGVALSLLYSQSRILQTRQIQLIGENNNLRNQNNDLRFNLNQVQRASQGLQGQLTHEQQRANGFQQQLNQATTLNGLLTVENNNLNTTVGDYWQIIANLREEIDQERMEIEEIYQINRENWEQTTATQLTQSQRTLSQERVRRRVFQFQSYVLRNIWYRLRTKLAQSQQDLNQAETDLTNEQQNNRELQEERDGVQRELDRLQWENQSFQNRLDEYHETILNLKRQLKGGNGEDTLIGEEDENKVGSSGSSSSDTESINLSVEPVNQLGWKSALWQNAKKLGLTALVAYGSYQGGYWHGSQNNPDCSLTSPNLSQSINPHYSYNQTHSWIENPLLPIGFNQSPVNFDIPGTDYLNNQTDLDDKALNQEKGKWKPSWPDLSIWLNWPNKIIFPNWLFPKKEGELPVNSTQSAKEKTSINSPPTLAATKTETERDTVTSTTTEFSMVMATETITATPKTSTTTVKQTETETTTSTETVIKPTTVMVTHTSESVTSTTTTTIQETQTDTAAITETETETASITSTVTQTPAPITVTDTQTETTTETVTPAPVAIKETKTALPSSFSVNQDKEKDYNEKNNTIKELEKNWEITFGETTELLKEKWQIWDLFGFWKSLQNPLKWYKRGDLYKLLSGWKQETETAIKELTTQLNSTETELKDNERVIATQENEIGDLETELNDKNDKIKDLENKNSELENKLDKIEKERDARPDIRKEDWDKDYSERPTQKYLEEEVAKVEEKFKGFIDPTKLIEEDKKKGMVAREDLEAAKKELDQKSDEITALNSQLAAEKVKQKDEVDQLKKDWGQQKKEGEKERELKDKENEKLKNEIKQVQKEKENLTKVIEDMAPGAAQKIKGYLVKGTVSILGTYLSKKFIWDNRDKLWETFRQTPKVRSLETEKENFRTQTVNLTATINDYANKLADLEVEKEELTRERDQYKTRADDLALQLTNHTCQYQKHVCPETCSENVHQEIRLAKEKEVVNRIIKNCQLKDSSDHNLDSVIQELQSLIALPGGECLKTIIRLEKETLSELLKPHLFDAYSEQLEQVNNYQELVTHRSAIIKQQLAENTQQLTTVNSSVWKRPQTILLGSLIITLLTAGGILIMKSRKNAPLQGNKKGLVKTETLPSLQAINQYLQKNNIKSLEIDEEGGLITRFKVS